MGKIVAVGGGFGGEHADFLVRCILSLCEKEKPNFLLIPTAGFDQYSNSMISRFFNWGCNVDVLCLSHPYMTREIAAEKIERADIINVPGGNLRFLMGTWKNTGADDMLRKAYGDGKVLFGDSSGAMCWFKQGFDDCAPEGEFMTVECTGILPYMNCPHYESEWWQNFNSVAPTLPIPSIALENDVAICFENGRCSLLHSPERIDARAWYFDPEQGGKRFDLDAHPEILERLGREHE